MLKIAGDLIRKHGLYESFYVASLGALRTRVAEWRDELPMIDPLYALKANGDDVILKEMVNMGMGFDCASKKEIATVLGHGADVKKLIFAHPVKVEQDLRWANAAGVEMTTFDSVSELEKIKRNAPEMKCVIRLKIDNPSARIQLSTKYGVEKDEYKDLIDKAADMGLRVGGASFHVGSATSEPAVFRTALEYSREVFAYARARGFIMDVLDVGGGFTGQTFPACAEVLRDGIADLFEGDEDEGLKIIAEPGRLFCEDVMTLVVPVIGNRVKRGVPAYWLADSVYGNFSCVIHDKQVPEFDVIRVAGEGDDEACAVNTRQCDDMDDDDECCDKVDSILYGSTCDSLDMIGTFKLPTLKNGDFLMVRNFGAYTNASACNFNGINMKRLRTFWV
jgi:ornithine decarboxylase